MPKVCLICSNPERKEIEKMIIQNVPYENIKEHWGINSKSVITRHKKHMGKSLAKSQEAKEVLNGDRLIKQLEDLQTKTLNILNNAERSEDWRIALGAIREARGNTELIAKLLGELKDSQVININPQWQEIRTIIISALEPYPEAKGELIKALGVIDVGNNQ